MQHVLHNYFITLSLIFVRMTLAAQPNLNPQTLDLGLSGHDEARLVIENKRGQLVFISAKNQQLSFSLIQNNGSSLSVLTRRGPIAAVGKSGANSLIQTRDGGYVIVGYTQNFAQKAEQKAWVLKINEDGDTLWTKVIPTNGKSEFFDVTENSENGDLWMTGESEGKLCLVQTDEKGKSTKIDSFPNKTACGKGLAWTKDKKNLMIVGRKMVGKEKKMLLLSFYTEGGKWRSESELTINAEGNRIVRDRKGNFGIVGTYYENDEYGDIFFARVNEKGDTLATNIHYNRSRDKKPFGLPYVSDEGLSIAEDWEGNFILAGARFTLPSDNVPCFWLSKITPDGQMPKELIKPKNRDRSSKIYSVISTKDSSIVVVGKRTEGLFSDALFMKINNNSSCKMQVTCENPNDTVNTLPFYDWKLSIRTNKKLNTQNKESYLKYIKINGKEYNPDPKDIEIKDPSKEKSKNTPLPKSPCHYKYSYKLVIHLKLEIGKSDIEAEISDGDTDTKTTISINQKERGRLLLLSIGINYEGNEKISPLKYAEADAISIDSVFKNQKGKLFNKIHNKTMIDSLETHVERIKSELKFWANHCEKEDILILFLSGHGGIVNGELSFFGSNYDPNDSTTVLSYKDISGLLNQSKGKSFLFSDACRTGWGKGISDPKKNKAFENITRATPTLRTLFSCEPMSSSFESEKYAHGIFTQALLEAFGNQTVPCGEGENCKANENDQTLTFRELVKFVEKRVPVIAKVEQRSQKPTPNINDNPPNPDTPIFLFDN